MALIKYSAAVAGASGKAGGIVFSRNRGGSYIRSWAKGVNPKTVAQTNQRNKLAGLSTAWKNLTQAQKDGWSQAALLSYRKVTNRLGEQTSLTGFQLFMKQNLLTQTIGLTNILQTAPLPMESPVLKEVSIAARALATDPFVITASFDQPVDLDLDELYNVVRFTPSTPVGQKPRAERIVGYTSVQNDSSNGITSVLGTNPLDVEITVPAAAVEAATGSIIPGSRFGVSVLPLNADDPWDTITTTSGVDSLHGA